MGSPTRPTSARSLSCSSTQPSSPAQPALGEARRLARGGGEALVAAPAVPAAGQHDAPARHHEVVLGAVPVDHLRARRDAHDEVVAVGAVAQRALRRGRRALRLVVGLALEALQVAQRVVAQQHDVAAAAAVAAVGAAARHVGLAAERTAAIPAAAALHEDARLVVEHARPIVERTRPMADDDKVFLITGASSGIGAATARRAAQAGLPPRAGRALGGQARGAGRRARRRRARAGRGLRRDRLGTAGGDGRRRPSSASAASTSPSPTPASARRAAS